ncbi:hypothetical protein BDZ94DRAFT_967955 [Collybia nuda]|uniref:Uncharacterized protein n=1 Tax=Collybia nuda TaxID=64659 RepID=A0A9P5YCK2_9AGAR|nr:hypothetical protein BDZ94DRAFT_967955 [Collybia nuda]
MFITALNSKDKRIRQYSCATIKDWSKRSEHMHFYQFVYESGSKYQNIGGSPSSLMTVKIIQGAIANLSNKIDIGEEWINDPILGVILEISKNHRLDRYGLDESKLIAKWSKMNNPGSQVNTLMNVSKYDSQRQAVLKHEDIKDVLNFLYIKEGNINRSAYQTVQEWIVHDDSRKAILGAGFIKILLDRFISERKAGGYKAYDCW